MVHSWGVCVCDSSIVTSSSDSSQVLRPHIQAEGMAQGSCLSPLQAKSQREGGGLREEEVGGSACAPPKANP